MTLEEFNSKYKYKSDKIKFGIDEVWEEPTLSPDGHYYGDCESYAIFLKRNINIFGDYNYYWCRLNGEGHCVLSDGNNVIDNNTRKIVSIKKYNKLFKVTEFRKFRLYELAYKFLLTKIVLLFK